VLDWLQHLSDCEATAIRLLDDGDYLYYVHRGFSDGFIRKETHLCSRDTAGRRIRDPDTGLFALDCMCGNVIRGQFDATLEFFTERGSFWTNATSILLASTTEDDRQGRTRNHCNGVGYESVALIPIRARDEIVGLIQLNDHREGRFDEGFIQYCEMIGEQIGLAVHNAMAYERVEETRAQLEHSNRELETLRRGRGPRSPGASSHGRLVRRPAGEATRWPARRKHDPVPRLPAGRFTAHADPGEGSAAIFPRGGWRPGAR